MIRNRLTLFYIILTFFYIKGFSSDYIELDSLLIEGESFYGYLYKPKGGTDLKPIIILGGSDGGIKMKNETREFAKSGFVALNLAYFDYKDLPKHLIDIPIEYFNKPIKWILDQEYVNSSSIAVFGFSRGAELALLIASEYPQISVTIAMSGAHTLWSGFRGWTGKVDTTSICAWTKSGKPLPYMNIPFDSLRYVNSKNNADYIRQDLKHEETVKKARIRIENSNSALLLISGAEDKIWPSSYMTECLKTVLDKEDYSRPYKNLIIENVGHYFDLKQVFVDNETCWDYMINFTNKNMR